MVKENYYIAIFLKHPNFAEIKTSVFNNQKEHIAKKRFKISAHESMQWDMPAIKAGADSIGVSPELLVKRLENFFKKLEKEKQKRSKKEKKNEL